MSVSYAMPKNSTSENYSPIQTRSLHHLQIQSEQRDIHQHFQQLSNQLHTEQIYETQKHEPQQNQLGKLFMGNLFVNVTVDDIYELFDLRTTKYLRSNIHVEMPLNRNGQTSFRHCPGPCKK